MSLGGGGGGFQARGGTAPARRPVDVWDGERPQAARNPLMERFGDGGPPPRPATAQGARTFAVAVKEGFGGPTVSRPATAQGVRGPSNCSRKSRLQERRRPPSACDSAVLTHMARVRESLSNATSLRMEKQTARKVIKPAPLPKWTPEDVAKTLGARLATKGMKCDTLFRRADVSGTGELSHPEFRLLLQDMNIVMSDSDFRTFILTIDTNDDGTVSYKEWIDKYGAVIRGHEYRGLDLPIGDKEYVFEHKKTVPNWSLPEIAQALETKLFSKSSNARKIFRLFDEDKSGSLTYEEYREALEFFNITMSDENFAVMIAEVDTNRDGNVSYNEFLAKYGHCIAGHGYTGLDLGHSYKFEQPPATPPPDVGPIRFLQVLKDKLLTRPRIVRNAFLRADKLREGALSDEHLRAVLSRIGVVVHDRTWNEFVYKLPKTQDDPPKVVYSHLLAEAGCFLHGLGDRFAREKPPPPTQPYNAPRAPAADIEVVHPSPPAEAAAREPTGDRDALLDAGDRAAAAARRAKREKLGGKRASKPGVPRQLRSPRRVNTKNTGANQRALVATLQRRVDARLRPDPSVLQRKAFQL